MSLRLRHCGRRGQCITELPLFLHAHSARSTLSESLLLRVSRLSLLYLDCIFLLHLNLIPICFFLPFLFEHDAPWHSPLSPCWSKNSVFFVSVSKFSKSKVCVVYDRVYLISGFSTFFSVLIVFFVIVNFLNLFCTSVFLSSGLSTFLSATIVLGSLLVISSALSFHHKLLTFCSVSRFASSFAVENYGKTTGHSMFATVLINARIRNSRRGHLRVCCSALDAYVESLWAIGYAFIPPKINN